ncbi:thioredoxin domain-containing protein [Sulfuritalea sp.]|uniref:DsbA family protein n=1 Tax=Sulfuritalea sp. TaxID=2480090 RepID=UPI00286DF0B2|nr:thioredoxin domain-containing protein [Sulfuritalea sp.]
MKQKTLFVIAALLLLLGFIVAALLYNVEKEEQAGQFAAANNAALVRMHSPSLGPAEASVVIVEFLDPACETCAAFYPLVKQIMAANPGRIRLVLRYAPFHKGSDQVVAALEAARKQGKYWQALEMLLARQNDWVQNHAAQVARIWPLLEAAGLDLQKLRSDMAAPEIAGVIEQDLLDAQTLKVTKTPEYFVNGKPLPRFGIEPLKQLIDEALAASRR